MDFQDGRGDAGPLHELPEAGLAQGAGPRVRFSAARAREPVDHAEDLFALGAGRAARFDGRSGRGVGKRAASNGRKRGFGGGGKYAKSLILLVELAGIEPATS